MKVRIEWNELFLAFRGQNEFLALWSSKTKQKNKKQNYSTKKNHLTKFLLEKKIRFRRKKMHEDKKSWIFLLKYLCFNFKARRRISQGYCWSNLPRFSIKVCLSSLLLFAGFILWVSSPQPQPPPPHEVFRLRIFFFENSSWVAENCFRSSSCSRLG